MPRTGIKSERIWSHIAYSRAIRIDNLVEIAGTSSSGPEGQVLHPGDMYAQTKQILEIMQGALEELGAGLGDVIRTRIFLTDISQWEEAGRAHGEAFGQLEHPPVSAMYGISALLHPDLLVEIEATAVVAA